EQAIRTWHRSNEASRRLATIPGVGSITASAIVATVANATEFKSARHFAAFLGLTPKECSTEAGSASAASRNKEMSTSAAFWSSAERPWSATRKGPEDQSGPSSYWPGARHGS